MYTLRFYSCDNCSLPEGLPSSSSIWLLTLILGYTSGIVQQSQSTALVSLGKELLNKCVLLDSMPYQSLSMVVCVLTNHNNECVVFSVIDTSYAFIRTSQTVVVCVLSTCTAPCVRVRAQFVRFLVICICFPTSPIPLLNKAGLQVWVHICHLALHIAGWVGP